MYCNNCGAKSDLDSVYCEKCGHKLGTAITNTSNTNITTDEKEKKEPNEKKRLLILLVSLLLCMLVIACLWFFFLDKEIKENNNDNKDSQVINSDGVCDYTIEVSSDFSFAVTHEKDGISTVNVVDEFDNPIKVVLTSDFDITYVTAPSGGYSEGKLYKIVLKNGKFVNDDYNKYNDVCFRIKKTIVNEEKKEEFKIGTYKHEENYITLNSDNTFILGVLANGEMVTYKGTYKIENYVLTCNTINDENNFGVFEFNINSEGDLTSLNNLGISNYSDIGTVYSYKE